MIEIISDWSLENNGDGLLGSMVIMDKFLERIVISDYPLVKAVDSK